MINLNYNLGVNSEIALNFFRGLLLKHFIDSLYGMRITCSANRSASFGNRRRQIAFSTHARGRCGPNRCAPPCSGCHYRMRDHFSASTL